MPNSLTVVSETVSRQLQIMIKAKSDCDFSNHNKLSAGGRHGMPPRPLSSRRGHQSASRGQADGNVAAVSHSQHVPTLTAAAA